MALTRNDKRVILVAVVMAVVVVGGLAWWRMSDRREVETSSVPESSLLAQFQTPSPQPFQVGAKTPSSSRPDRREVTPLGPGEPPEASAAQPQGAPSGPQEPQAAVSALQTQSARPPGPAEPDPQTQAAQPFQAAPPPSEAQASPPNDAPCVSNESGSNAREEQEEDQVATLHRAQDELRHAEFALKRQEREAKRKSEAPAPSSPAQKHDESRHVVEAVVVNETDRELRVSVRGAFGETKPQVMLLSSPSRLVIDLPGPWVYRGSAGPQSGLVKGIRTGKTPERLRLVADLADMPGWGRPVVETAPEGIIVRINKPARR